MFFLAIRNVLPSPPQHHIFWKIAPRTAPTNVSPGTVFGGMRLPEGCTEGSTTETVFHQTARCFFPTDFVPTQPFPVLTIAFFPSHWVCLQLLFILSFSFARALKVCQTCPEQFPLCCTVCCQGHRHIWLSFSHDIVQALSLTYEQFFHDTLLDLLPTSFHETA